jgi:transcriptional regulator with GAF, ATPase, and Fis domain
VSPDQQVFTEVSDEVIARLCELPLEGNVAEMENILHEAMAFANRDRSEAIELRHLRADVRDSVPQPPLPHHVRGRIPSREEIVEALNRNGWKIAKAAAEFKVTDRALRDWMSRYSIKRPN